MCAALSSLILASNSPILSLQCLYSGSQFWSGAECELVSEGVQLVNICRMMKLLFQIKLEWGKSHEFFTSGLSILTTEALYNKQGWHCITEFNWISQVYIIPDKSTFLGWLNVQKVFSYLENILK